MSCLIEVVNRHGSTHTLTSLNNVCSAACTRPAMTCLVDSIIGYTLFSLIKCFSTRLRDGTAVTRPALEERERESERQRRIDGLWALFH